MPIRCCLLLFIFQLFWPSYLFCRAAVLTSVTCRPAFGPVVVSESSCHESGQAGTTATFASAAVSMSLVLPGSPSGYLIASIPVRLVTDFAAPPGRFSEAEATATIQLDLGTGGPVRPGFIEWDSSFFHQFVTGITRVNLGPVSSTCVLSIRDIPTCPPRDSPVPIVLGQPFEFRMTRDVRVPQFEWTVDDTAEVRFRLFESDGVTPVAVELVPEPATVWLAGVALACAFAIRRRQRS